jgi:hypothetical protein
MDVNEKQPVRPLFAEKISVRRISETTKKAKPPRQ